MSLDLQELERRIAAVRRGHGDDCEAEFIGGVTGYTSCSCAHHLCDALKTLIACVKAMGKGIDARNRCLPNSGWSNADKFLEDHGITDEGRGETPKAEAE